MKEKTDWSDQLPVAEAQGFSVGEGRRSSGARSAAETASAGRRLSSALVGLSFLVFFSGLFVFMGLLVSSGLRAATPAEILDGALAGLAERYKDLNSFSAQYVRTTVTPAMDSVFKSSAAQTAEGLLQWEKVSKLRLDQKKPASEAMMTDGQIVWWHIPSEKLVYIYRDVDLAGELAPLLSFMSGLDDLREKFFIRLADGEDLRPGQTGLELAAKDGSEERGQIIIYCDEDYVLTGFRLSSLTGEKTDFFLSRPKMNPRFSKGHFVFEVPRGTTVIEEEEG
ncbi:MAG: outer-membrane lipoprotein carrier protein LolA [Deltaproteobacteria bacterium]|nr:outer-membrane lipoprotein carrier protein LolA [Deltaproteobacteria bacterium]